MICQQALNIRAHYEESILYVLAMYRRMISFAAQADQTAQADLLAYFANNGVTPPLADYLDRHRELADNLREFRQREELFLKLWLGTIEALSDPPVDPATVLTRRFRRVNRMWQNEKSHADSRLLNLIEDGRRDDFKTLVSTGMADSEFSRYLNTNIAGQYAALIWVHYEENILYLMGFSRRLMAVTRRLAPEWQAAFMSFYATGEIGQELAEYLETNQTAGGTVAEFQENEQELLRQRIAEAQTLATSSSTDRASQLIRRFGRIRRAWLEDEGVYPNW